MASRSFGHFYVKPHDSISIEKNIQEIKRVVCHDIVELEKTIVSPVVKATNTN